VHNLHANAWGRHVQEPYNWTISSETKVRELLLAKEYKPLINLRKTSAGVTKFAMDILYD